MIAIALVKPLWLDANFPICWLALLQAPLKQAHRVSLWLTFIGDIR